MMFGNAGPERENYRRNKYEVKDDSGKKDNDRQDKNSYSDDIRLRKEGRNIFNYI